MQSQKDSKVSHVIKTTEKYYENRRITSNTTKDSIPRRDYSQRESNQFTGQNIPSFGNPMIVPSDNYKISTYDSSLGTLQIRSTNDHNICNCGNLRNDNMSANYNTIQTSDYCTCDDGKDNSSANNNYYKRNTTKTIPKSRLDNQNIYIQDNIEYCSCEEREQSERQIFSNPNSEFCECLPENLIDEDNGNMNIGASVNRNVCTCNENQRRINSFQANTYNMNQNSVNSFDQNQMGQYSMEQNQINQNNMNNQFILGQNQIVQNQMNQAQLEQNQMDQEGQLEQEQYDQNQMEQEQINQDQIEQIQIEENEIEQNEQDQDNLNQVNQNEINENEMDENQNQMEEEEQVGEEENLVDEEEQAVEEGNLVDEEEEQVGEEENQMGEEQEQVGEEQNQIGEEQSNNEINQMDQNQEEINQNEELNQNKMSQNENDQNANQKYMQTSLNQNITTSYNELPIQTTDFEERGKEEKRQLNQVEVNEVNETNEININNQINQEFNIQRNIKESQEVENLWTGENYVQVIERMQFLITDPPELSVQFLNDMMINKTENNNPIQVLLPIPDNYIQKQQELAVIADEKDKVISEESEDEQEVLRNKLLANEDLCPENVDLLNISHAYSTPVPSFNNLEIENSEIFVPGIEKSDNEISSLPTQENFSIENYSLSCFANGKQPLIIENYGLGIDPSERSWSGNMKLVRINKLKIEVPTKPSWNDLIQEELTSKLDFEKSEIQKKEKKVKKERSKTKEKSKKKEKVKKKEKSIDELQKLKEEEEREKELREQKRKEKEKERQERKAQREREKQLLKEQKEKERQERREQREREKQLLKEKREKERQELREKKQKEKEEKELLRKKEIDPSTLETNNFTLYFKDSGKQFRKIDIGNNEVITLKSQKRILRPLEKSENNTLELGGKGFVLPKWDPIPMHAQVLNIENAKLEKPLENIPLDRMDFPAVRNKRPNWNLVNDTTSETTINLLPKEKPLTEQKVRPITIPADNINNNNWNEKVRKQKGVKLAFPSKKNWFLDISKEVNLVFEQDSDDVIVNDDYNNVENPQMRPIQATIYKVNEDDETSSVSSYDIFQNLIIKKTKYEFNFDDKVLKNREFDLSNGGNPNLKNKNKNNNDNKGKKAAENAEKNQNDQSANQKNNPEKSKKVEVMRDS